MIASLIFNEHELIQNLRAQFGDEIKLIDCGSTIPVEGAYKRYEDNLLWTGNWQRFLMELDPKEYPYVWMVNSDVEGLRARYFETITSCFNKLDFMGTYAFNSPHYLFHKQTGCSIRFAKWVDMTAPIINLAKFQELGGFDLRLKGYGADVDLCYRARQKGYTAFIDDSIRFHHIGGYTVNKNNTHEQSNAEEMYRLLCEKWGVNHWTELCQ